MERNRHFGQGVADFVSVHPERGVMFLGHLIRVFEIAIRSFHACLQLLSQIFRHREGMLDEFRDFSLNNVANF